MKRITVFLLEHMLDQYLNEESLAYQELWFAPTKA